MEQSSRLKTCWEDGRAAPIRQTASAWNRVNDPGCSRPTRRSPWLLCVCVHTRVCAFFVDGLDGHREERRGIGVGIKGG